MEYVNKARLALLGLVMSLFGQMAIAGPILDVRGGQLLGASGIDVGGTLYDVAFQDGRCADLFDGCDSVSDFTFQTESDALSAATALLDSVFLDGSYGLFDSNPALTNGCIDPQICLAVTPYAPITSVYSIATAWARNLAPELFLPDDDATSRFVGDLDFSHTFHATWAVWSEQAPPVAAVPEPGSLALLSLGVAGICFSRRKQSKSSV